LTLVHDGRGDFLRTPEAIARDQRAADMRSMGYTFQQIGDQLGVTRQAAHQMVQRAIRDVPVEGVLEMREVEKVKLDRLERFYHTVLARKHVKVAPSGKIVYGEDGEALEDEQPRLEAAAGLLKVHTQRAKLLGLNAPTVNEVIVYDIERDTRVMLDAQIAALHAIGLGDKADEFRRAFVAALDSGAVSAIDAESRVAPV